LSPLLPLPRIHTTRGCFGCITNSPEHHGHAHWLAEEGGARALKCLQCSPDRVVPAHPAALDPHGAASSRPRGSCWAGSQPPEATRPAPGAVAGWAKVSPETCSAGAHEQCSRCVAWASVETAVLQRSSRWKLSQVPGGALWRSWCFFWANDRGRGQLYHFYNKR